MVRRPRNLIKMYVMGKSVKGLYKDLNSIPRTHIQAITAVCIWSPSTREAEMERVAVTCWPTSLVVSASSRPVRDPLSAWGHPMAYTCILYMCTYTHTHNTRESLLCAFPTESTVTLKIQQQNIKLFFYLYGGKQVTNTALPVKQNYRSGNGIFFQPNVLI